MITKSYIRIHRHVHDLPPAGIHNPDEYMGRADVRGWLQSITIDAPAHTRWCSLVICKPPLTVQLYTIPPLCKGTRVCVHARYICKWGCESSFYNNLQSKYPLGFTMNIFDRDTLTRERFTLDYHIVESTSLYDFESWLTRPGVDAWLRANPARQIIFHGHNLVGNVYLLPIP